MEIFEKKTQKNIKNVSHFITKKKTYNKTIYILYFNKLNNKHCFTTQTHILPEPLGPTTTQPIL